MGLNRRQSFRGESYRQDFRRGYKRGSGGGRVVAEVVSAEL
jgi:hypothetical protein